MSAATPYHIHTNGKLLLSAEYFVLDGAQALALPTKLGQSFAVRPLAGKTNEIHWKSLTKQGSCWFEATFSLFPLQIIEANHPMTARRVLDLLENISRLRPSFWNKRQAFQVETRLDFSREWGLGSSSTLVSALSQWATVDPYQLLADTFGGSGYDLACAVANGPLLYQRQNQRGTYVETPFRPTFADQLYFVYLGKKQNSREGIQRYRSLTDKDEGLIRKISQLSLAMANATALPDFEKIILEHERLVSQTLQLDRAQNLHFSDFPGEIKSLGAWGGDFVLATSPFSPSETMNYFQQKGYNVIFSYHDLIL